MRPEEGLVDGLDALLAAGRRLLELDRGRFERILELVRAYVAVLDCEEETAAEFEARLRKISPDKVKIVA